MLHALGASLTDEMIRHEGITLPYTFERADSVFALLVVCFFIFAYVYQGGFSLLRENITMLFSIEKSSRRQYETTSRDVWNNYLLVFSSFILIAICLYDAFATYCGSNTEAFSKPDYASLLTIVSFVLIFIVFFLLKHVLNVFIGYVFNVKLGEMGYRGTTVIALEILGVIYFIPTLLLIYSDYWHSQIIGFMLISFLIVKLILFYRIIVHFIREKFNFLFLFAYLCSSEIIPYLFLALGLYLVYRMDVYNLILCL